MFSDGRPELRKPEDELYYRPVAGSFLPRVIEEALAKATRYQKRVVFIFNGTPVEVEPDSTFETVHSKFMSDRDGR